MSRLTFVVALVLGIFIGAIWHADRTMGRYEPDPHLLTWDENWHAERRR